MGEKVQILLIRRPVLSLLILFLVLIFLSSALIYVFEDYKLSWVDSLFTGFSASTITGLTVIDTHTLSFASQIVILIDIQTGAFLAMGGAVFIIILARHRRMLHQGSVSAASLFLGERLKDIGSIFLFMLIVESISAVLLFFHFKDSMGAFQGAWYAIFHAVSGFCGAGFFLFPDNLYSFRQDPFVLSVIMCEIILGGLGFLVIVSIKIRLLSLLKGKKIYGWPIHVKLTLVTTAALLVLGFVVFLGLERETVLVSVFQSVTRIAGFSTVDMADTQQATRFLFSALMFIGAGSMSVSGGIKVTTFSVLIIMIWTRYRRRREAVIWKRVIPQSTLSRANGVFLLSFATVSGFIFVLLITEKFAFDDILFEATSAFGTVGLSTGITPSLTIAGKILISTLMLVGRIGPLALTYLLGGEIIGEKSSYLEEEIEVG